MESGYRRVSLGIYLPNSIDAFLTTENLCKELKIAGLEPIHVKAFSMNISTLIIARKI